MDLVSRYMSSELEISKVWSLSTCHITEHIDGILSDEEARVLAYPNLSIYTLGVHGYMICLPDPDYDLLDLPDCLARIIEMARRNDVYWIIIDRDGFPVRSLQVYDW